MANLNVELNDDTMQKAKAKAAMLGISLKEYISILIIKNTEGMKIQI